MGLPRLGRRSRLTVDEPSRRRRIVALLVALAALAMALAFGAGAAVLLVLAVAVIAGVVYSLATVGDWMQAWGRRAGDSERRQR
jgi:fatty acid desaturase